VTEGTQDRQLVSVRIRAAAALLLGIAGGTFFGMMMVTRSQDYVWLAGGVPAAAGAYVILLRCPACGTSIARRRARWLGLDFTYWGGLWVPRRCSGCGRNLP